jgi:hypothetical protein
MTTVLGICRDCKHEALNSRTNICQTCLMKRDRLDPGLDYLFYRQTKLARSITHAPRAA